MTPFPEINAAMAISRRQLGPIGEIKLLVGQEWGVRVKALEGPRRCADLAAPRFAVYYLAQNEAQASLNQIGRCLGDRDHTTVMHGIRRCREIMDRDRAYAARVRRVAKKLGGDQ